MILQIKVFQIRKLTMTNILLILFFVIILLFFYSTRNNKSTKKTIISPTYVTFLKEQEFNPDISTDNWDLHKLRLDKFKRSQYKGLTFFVSSENKIYYLSENGDKVYC
ncbi:possible Cytochrome b(C-terminal)/b6/petD [Prochlorococcus marinus str. AS9601]|uniref:Possible Cytochrome b(C-terminal)/b6/petD n=2 Tax=Prochlorococcus marinus TaxID=1219 RepID=A2BS33_PROMS|nr:possible Cytochrome b(C-terminal)/b6/petD [Prochlorococcus marinus str. AS9601]